MPRDLSLSVRSSSAPKTYFLPDNGSVPNDVLGMVFLMPTMKLETGRHNGIRGRWVFSPGTETLDSLEKYRVHNNVPSRESPRRDEPRRLLQERPSKPKPRKDHASPQKDSLQDSGRRLERDMHVIRQKEQDLEKEKANLVKSSYAHEEKARALRKSITRAKTQPPNANVGSLSIRDDSRNRNKRRVDTKP